MLKPVEPFANLHDYDGNDHNEAYGEEEPKEPLGIMTKVATVIFLVSLTNLLTLIGKLVVELSNMPPASW